MKISSKLLLGALIDVSRCVGSKSNFVSTTCVHLRTFEGKLYLSADNLDQKLVRSVECEGDIDPALVRYSWLKAAIGSDEFCKIETRGPRIRVYNGNTKSDVSLENIHTFPEDPERNYRLIGTTCKDISAGIKAVKPFQHRGIDRAMMNCVHVIGSPKSLTVESTNSTCAARWVESVISADFDLMVSREFVDTVEEYLAIDGAELMLHDRWGKILFPGGEYRFRLSAELFPKTDHIFSETGSLLAEFEPDPFIRFCQQAISYSADGGHAVIQIRFSPEGVFMGTTSEYYDISAFIPGQYPEFSVKLNAAYMIQIMKSFPEKVKIFGGEHKTSYSGGNLNICLASMHAG